LYGTHLNIKASITMHQRSSLTSEKRKWRTFSVLSILFLFLWHVCWVCMENSTIRIFVTSTYWLISFLTTRPSHEIVDWRRFISPSNNQNSKDVATVSDEKEEILNNYP
jgi:hypothetical protein